MGAVTDGAERSREALFGRLSPHGQQHLLGFWGSLAEHERHSLAAELCQIDFRLMERLYQQRDSTGDEVRKLADRATSPPSFRLGQGGEGIAPQEACRRGTEALRAGHFGAILVAGGQGTRLGFDHPKGMFPIGPVSGKTLFQIHVEKIVAASRRYGVPVPLYLMTSPATHHETVEFFARHQRFGLPEEDLWIFCQGTMPAVDAASGRILLDGPGHVALGPDGHGGMLAAFDRSGALSHARDRGIRHFFYFQVDNPAVGVCGPEFLGYHLLCGAEMTTQVVRKQDPLEKVGNVVQVDGRLWVIEYSDLPEEVARRRGAEGSLEIWAGSIAVHAFDLGFLERMARSAEGLPFHRARKKVPFVDPGGRRIEPQAPNAIKFEQFIFDLMPSAARAIVVEVDPVRHFAPLKNGPDEKKDTAATVRAQMIALHTEWLRRAGAEVADGVAVEISPLVALDAGELAGKIRSGARITKPTYFG